MSERNEHFGETGIVVTITLPDGSTVQAIEVAMAEPRDESAPAKCEHIWLHLREVPFTHVQGTWGDELYCRRCLAKRQVAR